MPNPTPRRSHQTFGAFLLLILSSAPLLLLGALLRGHREGPDSEQVVFLPSGQQAGGADLFTLNWNGGDQAWHVAPGLLTPTTLDGKALAQIPARGSTRVVLDRYIIDVSTALAGQQVSEALVDWTIAGALLHVGDEVGRAPAFYQTGRLTYAPWRVFALGNGVEGRKLPLWIDSLPTRAFVMRPLADCGGGTNVACVEISGGGRGRATIQTVSPQRAFRRLTAGDVVGIPADGLLWFGHVPLAFTNRGGDAWLVEMGGGTGERLFLGELASQDTMSVPLGRPIHVRNVTDLFKGTSVPAVRWSPETEDEYQILIDEELLCITEQDAAGRAVPQIEWRSPLDRGCSDALDRAPPPLDAAVHDAVFDIYDRRRREDVVVLRSNEVLRGAAFQTSADALPFVFEWWTARNADRMELIPLRLWGIRTQATRTRLLPDSGGATLATDPPIVVHGRQTGTHVLAVTASGTRLYADRDALLGLGPLLGVRDKVDGLDQVAIAIGRRDRLPEIELTIDADLQRALWSSIRAQLTKVSLNPGRRRTWGVTAIALDPADGSILADVNWPEAMEWEDPSRHAALGFSAIGGRPRASFNRAMLRAENVGSTLKVLTIYAMANALVLDHPAAVPGKEGGQPFIAFQTLTNGTVRPLSRRAYLDGRAAPLPIGVAGMRGALNKATARSSNTYFALAATMLLGGPPPPVRYLETCPIARDGRRLDAARAGEWVICRGGRQLSTTFNITARAGKGMMRPDVTTVLLLPPDEKLFERAQRPFKSAPAPGFFLTALNAGFTILDDGTHGPAGARLVSYEGFPRRRNWFPDIPGAEHRLFEYPAVRSPGAYFGPASENFNGVSHTLPSGTWRDFAQQALGEGGMGSALSLAVLYSAVARDDGMIPSPRLVRNGSSAPPPTPVFPYSDARIKAIHLALEEPLNPGGTAAALAAPAQAAGVKVRAKTGTFWLMQDPSDADMVSDDFATRWLPCGALEKSPTGALNVPAAPGWRALLGTAYCERSRTVVTAVHRYPATVPPEPTDVGFDADPERERFTSFVAIIEAPGARPIVLALISDIHLTSASEMVGKLLPAVRAWAQGRARP